VVLQNKVWFWKLKCGSLNQNISLKIENVVLQIELMGLQMYCVVIKMKVVVPQIQFKYVVLENESDCSGRNVFLECNVSFVAKQVGSFSTNFLVLR